MTLNAEAATTIGAEATIPRLSSIDYWSFMGATPYDGSVQAINPPLFKWNYCLSTERDHPGEDQINRDLHVFRFQLSTNGSFASPYWDIYTSNNFENCLPPITNANGTHWAGTCSWRIIYYDRMISSILETDVIHTFTLASNATNWDRSMLRDSNYLYSVTQYHPHMYFNTNSRTAFADYLRNSYAGDWGWSYTSNAAIHAINNTLTQFEAGDAMRTNWWNNEEVFTNLSNPQDAFTFTCYAAMMYQLDTNQFVATNHLADMIDMGCRWALANGRDRVPSYQNFDYDWKALAYSVDWAWPLMNTAQRSNAVVTFELFSKFYVWEDWWCTGSAMDFSRVYAYTNRFINSGSAGKMGDSHQRTDSGVGFAMAMACLADSTNLQEMFPYYMNYFLGFKEEGRQDEGRGYNMNNLYSDRPLADDLESVFLFRSAQLERNPLFGQITSQLTYFEPVNFYEFMDPFGDFGNMGKHDGTISNLKYCNFSTYNLGILLQNGAMIRQYNRMQAIYSSTTTKTPFDPLQNTAIRLLYSVPTETDWPSNDWVVPEQGFAVLSSKQPNDWGAFTDAVAVVTSANPATKNEHGQIADGALQMWAYGACINSGGVDDFQKMPWIDSGMILVDGIGPVRYEGAPFTVHRAQFTAFTNSVDFSYLESDITRAYPSNSYTYDFLSNFNTAAYYYQFPTNSRPYLTSMKRSILFPHRKYFVLYDTMTATQPANFQWIWKYLEPTGTVNTNGCSFTYTCTNVLNGSNVTVYVVPFTDPDSMTCTPLLSTNFAYTNIITGEHIASFPDGPSGTIPPHAGNIWVQNTAASTNWHFGNVAYPRRWDEPAPTITRLDDFTVKVVGYTNDGSAYPGHWVQFTDTNTFDTNYSGAFSIQVALANASTNDNGGGQGETPGYNVNIMRGGTIRAGTVRVISQ